MTASQYTYNDQDDKVLTNWAQNSIGKVGEIQQYLKGSNAPYRIKVGSYFVVAKASNLESVFTI